MGLLLICISLDPEAGIQSVVQLPGSNVTLERQHATPIGVTLTQLMPHSVLASEPLRQLRKDVQEGLTSYFGSAILVGWCDTDWIVRLPYTPSLLLRRIPTTKHIGDIEDATV
jgi:hypothetical protein